jgi:hypothetical protein
MGGRGATSYCKKKGVRLIINGIDAYYDLSLATLMVDEEWILCSITVVLFISPPVSLIRNFIYELKLIILYFCRQSGYLPVN